MDQVSIIKLKKLEKLDKNYIGLHLGSYETSMMEVLAKIFND